MAQETRRSYMAGECSAEQAMVQMIAVRVTQLDSSCIENRKVEATELMNEALTEAENKSGS